MKNDKDEMWRENHECFITINCFVNFPVNIQYFIRLQFREFNEHSFDNCLPQNKLNNANDIFESLSYQSLIKICQKWNCYARIFWIRKLVNFRIGWFVFLMLVKHGTKKLNFVLFLKIKGCHIANWHIKCWNMSLFLKYCS